MAQEINRKNGLFSELFLIIGLPFRKNEDRFLLNTMHQNKMADEYEN